MPALLRHLLCLSLFLLSAAPLAAGQLRVATYNLQNYTAEFRRIEGRGEPAYPKPEKEKAALRLMIRAANADLLALQEIGGADYVEELRRDLAREGFSYPYVATLSGPDDKRQLAVLSKKPFKKITPHADIPIHYQDRTSDVARGLLAVTLDTAAGEFTFYTLHLKSRLTHDTADPQSAAQRLAEATALRDRIRAAHAGGPGALVLVGGDFNDTTTSAPLRRFTTAGKGPFLTLLPARDSRGETWTYRNKRDDYYSRSDYFLHSPALAPHVRGPARIADLPAADTASDHRLVCIDLDFGED